MDKNSSLVLTQEQVDELKMQINVRAEHIINLTPDFQNPFKFLTDYLLLQSEINAYKTLLDNHEDALAELASESEDDPNE